MSLPPRSDTDPRRGRPDAYQRALTALQDDTREAWAEIIDEADLPLLFEPFFRSERVRERGSAGVGLGLALCRRIVEAHRGHIEAKALETGGLEVSFSVPLSLG